MRKIKEIDKRPNYLLHTRSRYINMIKKINARKEIKSGRPWGFDPFLRKERSLVLFVIY